MTMTDAEVAMMIESADAFRERLRDAIGEAVAAVDPQSACAEEAHAGLKRIASTLDQVELVTFASLSNLDVSMTKRIGTGLMPMIELHLLAVGGGPTLDYADADAFLAQFERLIDLARKRKIN
jgi:hypothetical protein